MSSIVQDKSFPTDEYIHLLNSLNGYHSVFYKLWSVGKPSLSEEVSTAAVYFDQAGQFLRFIVNPVYWNSIPEIKKLFIICHECSHLIYDHGARLPNVNADLKNYAADLVVNHSLVNKYGFIRNEIDPDNNFCWIDNLFDEQTIKDQNITENETLETYYKLLKKYANLALVLANTVDDHDKTLSSSNDRSKIFYESDISDSEANDCIASNNAGNKTLILNKEVARKKKKWETVIKHWSKKYLTESEKNKTQWIRISRRMVMCNVDELLLPSDVEISNKDKKKKIDVFFFLDTSGSCVHLAKRFFRAANSLPKDVFNVKLFCFDTKVYETTLPSRKLYGFGGTNFNCINARVNQEKNHPEAVFIITDMYANSKPSVKLPKKWHFFSTTDYKGTLPTDANFYKLSDFE